MKQNEILDIISNIDNDLILEAQDELYAKKKGIPFKKWGSAAAAFILVVAISFIAMQNKDAPSKVIENSSSGPISQEQSISSVPAVTDDEVVPQGFLSRGGKSISMSLNAKLDNIKDNDELTISALISIDESYIFGGKSIKEYLSAVSDEELYLGKLGALFKEGDELKYGEKLYTDGLPDGTKWAKTLYEERVAFYGEEILSTYIVDGVFLKQKLEEDIQKAFEESKLQSQAEKDYERAKNAYLTEVGKDFSKRISAEISVEESHIVFKTTKADFEKLSLSGISKWRFDAYFFHASDGGSADTPVTDDQIVTY